MGAKASQFTSLAIVYSTVYSDADQIKHQSSASLAFVRGNHRGPVNSPHKWPVTPKRFPFDDVIMEYELIIAIWNRAYMTGQCIRTWQLTLQLNYFHCMDIFFYKHFIRVTVKWRDWHLNSPAQQLFTQPFIQAQKAPANSSHKGPVMRKRFPFADVIMSVHFKLIFFVNVLLEAQFINYKSWNICAVTRNVYYYAKCIIAYIGPEKLVCSISFYRLLVNVFYKQGREARQKYVFIKIYVQSLHRKWKWMPSLTLTL